MVIFHSYVSLPEGKSYDIKLTTSDVLLLGWLNSAGCLGAIRQTRTLCLSEEELLVAVQAAVISWISREDRTGPSGYLT